MRMTGSEYKEGRLLAIRGQTIARQVFWLAAPVVVEQFMLYLVFLSDTVLTGRFLSQEHLAAVTVATYLLWFLGSVIIVVSAGATALVARLIGANERADAARICQQSIGLALVVGTLTLAGGWVLAPIVVRILNLSGVSAQYATLFLRIILTITPLQACEVVGIACLRGAGDTRTGMWVMGLVNAINVAFSWALMRGFGPIAALGFPGIALGTALGEGTGGIVVLIVLARGRSGLSLSLAGMRPVARQVWRIVRISWPAAGESITNLSCQLWFLGLINRLGATATAAHGVAIRGEAIAFLTVAAFAVAASTLTGQYLGARRPDLAARAAHTAWGAGVVVLALLGVVLYTQAEAMFALFLGSRQPQVAAEGVPVLRIVAFALPAFATINVLSGALRGAGDTRWPWVIVLFGYIAVRLPLTYLFTQMPSHGGFGWGLRGAWIAMFIDLTVRGFLLAARFLQGGWRWAKV
ncbi:MAG TPA: MATE family efflux transporter [Isosphaeraceae bacterium]|jgi:putative MATE family efflux protein|nr:MATE family efflux transporter [Isosphaeraceae bacterium]